MNRAFWTSLFALAACISGLTDHEYAELFVVGALVVGLSHGAVDHLLSGGRYIGESLTFYVAYLAMLAVMGLLWFMTPAGATWAFFLVSAYHFGQSDFLTTDESPDGTPLLWWSRGLLIVISPLSAWPEQSSEFISLLVADSGAIAQFVMNSDVPRWSIPLWLLAAHLGVLGPAVMSRSAKVRIAVEAVALALLMTLTPPFIGFAVYFVTWHTAAHWRWVRARLNPRNLIHLLVMATPMTVLAAVGLVGLYYWFQPTGGSLLRWSIIGVSALAVPHMVVVEMTSRVTSLDAWRKRNGLRRLELGSPSATSDTLPSDH